MTQRTRPDLVEEMIKLIRPDTGSEARCREKIGESIIRIEKAEPPAFLPPVGAKAEMKQLHRALEKVKRLVSKLSFFSQSSLFHDRPRSRSNRPEIDQEIDQDLDQYFGANAAEFARVLDLLIEKTGEFANRLKPPKAAPRRSWSKIQASGDAYLLIDEFAERPPALTKDGTFFQVASRLLEAGTGEQKADLTRYCRDTASNYSQGAIELAKLSSGLFREDPAVKAAAEELATFASRKRRGVTQRTDG
jgi:hypothetical protein